MTLRDTDGIQVGDQLKTTAHQNAVKLSLSTGQVRDIAAFLHSQVMVASGRGQIRTDEVLVGDPNAGEAYFNGAGRCSTCHSVTGDLKGIGRDSIRRRSRDASSCRHAPQAKVCRRTASRLRSLRRAVRP